MNVKIDLEEVEHLNLLGGFRCKMCGFSELGRGAYKKVLWHMKHEHGLTSKWTTIDIPRDKIEVKNKRYVCKKCYASFTGRGAYLKIIWHIRRKHPEKEVV